MFDNSEKERNSMPYKNKEDRTGAVRRYRDKQRERKEMAKKAQEIDASLGNVLRMIGFEDIPFGEFVEICRDIEKDDKGVWYDRSRGKVIYPPKKVFFGLNTLIAGNHIENQINALAILFQDMFDYEEDYNPES